MGIKRYKWDIRIDDCGPDVGHFLEPDGEWVLYEDHTAEIAALRAELEKRNAVYEAAMDLHRAEERNDEEHTESSGAKLNTAWTRFRAACMRWED